MEFGGLLTGAAVNAAGKGASGAAASKAVRTAFDMNASDWKLSNKIKGLAAESAVLGPNRRLNAYIKTPLIESLFSNMSDNGVVFVALVPPGAGKTVAATAFFHCVPMCKGISVCPLGTASTPYHELLAEAVSVSASKKGWMQVALRTLHDSSISSPEGTHRTRFLILDEFLAGLSENDAMTPMIQADIEFVFNIKNLIADTNVCVVVLTPSEFGAGLALGSNGLSGIQPLPGLFNGTPSIHVVNNLKVGVVQWIPDIWSVELLIDLVVLHHGTFFTRDEIGVWIRKNGISGPKRVLQHANREARRRDNSIEYVALPCDVENPPDDLSAPLLCPPEPPMKLFLGCIPYPEF